MSKFDVYQSAIKKGRICVACRDYEVYVRIEIKGMEIASSDTGDRVKSRVVGVDLI
jgi:hypothetical protein